MMQLIDNELSEPYSIFTYRQVLAGCLPTHKCRLAAAGLLGDTVSFARYFLHNWPSLCFLAFDRGHCFGTVICKLDDHNGMLRGYIAMLVVEQAYRGCGAGAVPR